jgi:hypothetical protein
LIPSGLPSSAKREVNPSTFSNGRKRLVLSTHEVVCGAGASVVLGVCCSCNSLLIFRRSMERTSAAKPPLMGQPWVKPSF